MLCTWILVSLVKQIFCYTTLYVSLRKNTFLDYIGRFHTRRRTNRLTRTHPWKRKTIFPSRRASGPKSGLNSRSSNKIDKFTKLAMEAMVYGKFSIWRGQRRLERKGTVTKSHLGPVVMRSNLSGLSVHCPSFMNLCRTTLAKMVVLNSN